MSHQGGTIALRSAAGPLVFILLCVLCAAAATADHEPLMFRADPWHSGVNDDGGTRPAGILKWSFQAGDRVYSSPAVADGIVYIGSDDSRVYALDAETGAEVWHYTTGGRVLGSPAVSEGAVFVGSYDKNIYALDRDTGMLLWSFPTGGWVTSSPTVVGDVVYSGSLDDKLYAIDAVTGTEIWNASFGESPSVYSSPAVSGGVLYVSGGDLTLYALDTSDGREIWNFTTGNPISPSPAIVDGILYVATGDMNIYALDASTGAEVWHYATGGGGEMESSPAVAYGMVYIGSGDNSVYALDARLGVKVWSFSTGNVVYSSPTVANGVVYVGSWDHNLYALDALTGAEIWHFTTGDPVFSSPAVSSGLVYFGSMDGSVYAVGSAPGPTNLLLGNLAPAFYDNASVMNYTLFYRNNGDMTAINVLLMDTLPNFVEFVSGSGNPAYDSDTGTVTWNLGSLAPHATGMQRLTVRIPSSVPYDTVLNNTAGISTSNPESRYDDNIAWALTTLKEPFIPPGVAVKPSVLGPWSSPSVNFCDEVTFSYNQTLCPSGTPVSILIHIDDGGPDITAPMSGGPQYWDYSTTFFPRHGAASITYNTPGCVISGIIFPVNIEASGYVYDAMSGHKIEGATVWLQWPDANGDWVNVPAGSGMEPDQNPVVTNSAGQYQWQLPDGTYRVYVEASGHTPAASTMVNSPPDLSGLNVGLMPTTGTIWVGSEPAGAEIILDRGDTGFVTNHRLEGVGAGDHTIGLALEGYRDFQANVTVIAGETAVIRATLAPLPVDADFSANETFGMVPMTVRFTDSSTGQALTYQWDFGDGTLNSTDQNPVHTYAAGGTYNVTLTVSNSAGTSTLRKDWYITAMEPIPPVGGEKAYYMIHSNVDGAEVYFNGDWFEGTIENGTLLVQTCTSCTPVGSYTVSKCGYFPLTQVNHEYPGKDETVHLYANLTAPKEPLIADFTANVTEASAAPLTVQFMSSHIGVAETWNWTFGDGTYSEEEDPAHTYMAPGNYTVSLHLSNSACQEDTVEKEGFIRIYEKPPFHADFSVAPAHGPAPLKVQCTDTSTGNPTGILYDFGDGFKSMEKNPFHTYRTPGTYTITMTITKYDLATRSLLKSVAVRPGAVTVSRAPVPILAADFSASPVTGSVPFTVAFMDESLGDPTFYIYDFGDGFKAMGPNPSHTYKLPGNYTVSLKVLKIGAGAVRTDTVARPGLILATAG